MAALLVMWSHQHVLMGLPEPAALPFHTWGGVGLLVFFSISGYLVTQSWHADPHWGRYLARRALRIWPALATLAVVTAMVLGPCVSQLTLHEYAASSRSWAYLKLLWLKDDGTLPGVFVANPVPHAVNGSLWSIPLEVRCYIVLGLVGLAGGLRRPVWMLGVLCLLAWVNFVINDAGRSAHRQWAVELGVFFAAGSVWYQYRAHWVHRPLGVAICLLLIGVVLAMTDRLYVAVLVCLPFAVIWLGHSSTPAVRQVGAWGDPSYGLYLYAFPVQQTLVWATGNHWPFWLAMSASLGCTLMLAFVSWHVVERPCLRLKRHLRPVLAS